MLIQEKKRGGVTFICDLKSKANEIYLVGNFNQWDPHQKKMTKAKDGSYRCKMNFPPGRYQYKFVIDGIWHDDPDVKKQVLNSYGTYNSLFEVTPNPDRLNYNEWSSV